MHYLYSRLCIYCVFCFIGMAWYGGCNVLGKNEVLGRHDVLATNQGFQMIEFFDYRKPK